MTIGARSPADHHGAAANSYVAINEYLLLLLLLSWSPLVLQTEEFYNFADENGLLIWQDAMFGGSHYPRTQAWLDNYAEEIAQQASAVDQLLGLFPLALSCKWLPLKLCFCKNKLLLEYVSQVSCS